VTPEEDRAAFASLIERNGFDPETHRLNSYFDDPNTPAYKLTEHAASWRLLLVVASALVLFLLLLQWGA
jgi:hypothetical protein